jgi:hypothetical protein
MTEISSHTMTSLQIGQALSTETLEQIYRDVKNIVTSNILIPVNQENMPLSVMLKSEHLGRWKIYWQDQQRMPMHDDMNMAGHLQLTENEILKVTEMLPSDDSSQRTRYLLLITGWIHDLGEIAEGDVLFQSIDISARQREKMAFRSLSQILFADLSIESNQIINQLYDSVALPLSEQEKNHYLKPIFDTVERIGYLRTALDVAVNKYPDVQSNLLSTSVFHYHQSWFAKNHALDPILQTTFQELAPVIHEVLTDKKLNPDRTRQELEHEFNLEVQAGKRESFSKSDLNISFDKWWDLVSNY